MDLPAMIPDLWSVRAVTADLPTPQVRAEFIQSYDIGPPETTTAASLKMPMPELRSFVINNPSPEEQEWLRLWAATPDKRRLNPEAAFPAITSALEREDHTAAREFLEQAMQVINLRGDKGLGQKKSSRLAGLFSQLLRHGKSFIALLCASFRSSNMTENPAQHETTYSDRVSTPAATYQRGIVFSLLGDLELAARHLEEARAAFAESLQIRRQLREASGDTPQALRDLSVSLNNIGDVEQALNRHQEARAAFAESLQIDRQLREASGDTPQALRDLSVSLNKIGEVEQALNRHQEARAAFAESLQIHRQLREATGDTPQALRDLSVSLNRIGEVEQALNRHQEARAAFAEAQEIRRRLQEVTSFPESSFE
jgi:tetratricopeptide (TPR) repeat protein